MTSLRRLFLLIALLALVLDGPVPASAAGRPGAAAAACDPEACSRGADGDEDRAEARSLNPLQAQRCAAGSRRCHPGRPGTVPAAAIPRVAALESGPAGGSASGPEPAPWPLALVQAVPWTGPAAAGSVGASHPSLPEAFPGVLARTCVLRI